MEPLSGVSQLGRLTQAGFHQSPPNAHAASSLVRLSPLLKIMTHGLPQCHNPTHEAGQADRAEVVPAGF